MVNPCSAPNYKGGVVVLPFSLKSTLAAIFVSTALVGANAANHDHGHDQEHRGFHEFQPPDEADNSGYFDHMTMGPPLFYAAPYDAHPVNAVPQVLRHRAQPEPRLARIENEVRTAHNRVDVDHKHGLLNVAEARHLLARADSIRIDAVRVARAHDGALPEARYAALQQRIARLDGAIRLAATT